MTIFEIYKLVSIISAISVLIPFSLCIIKSKTHNQTSWVLFVYLILCIISEGASFILELTAEQENAIFNLFTILECCAFCYMYILQYHEKYLKNSILIAFLLFVILAIYVFVVCKAYNAPDDIVRTFEAAIMIVFSGIYFYKLLYVANDVRVTQDYFYWINLALLLYFSSVLLLFMNSSFLEHCKPTTAYILWGLHHILNLSTNILIAIGIWKLKPKRS